jgi:hypothetical protein
MNFKGSETFPLVMLSAMYENGGNTTHRTLDGHPELFVYPFESQVGTRLVQDQWTSLYPQKYRWPEFLLSASLEQDYFAIIDEEGKVRSRTPNVSKFRHWPFDMNDDERRGRFVELMRGVPRTRANLACAFFAATFDTWKDLNRSGQEHVYVGYSPVFGIDSEKFCSDLPAGHVLHVVRNPWSAYADTKRRPVPLNLHHYMAGWVTVQNAVIAAKEIYPERVHVVRFEDLVQDKAAALGEFFRAVEVSPDGLVPHPTWNGQNLDEVYPWGTVRKGTAEENVERARELSVDETREIERLTRPLLSTFSYEATLELVTR